MRKKRGKKGGKGGTYKKQKVAASSQSNVIQNPALKSDALASLHKHKERIDHHLENGVDVYQKYAAELIDSGKPSVSVSKTNTSIILTMTEESVLSDGQLRSTKKIPISEKGHRRSSAAQCHDIHTKE